MVILMYSFYKRVYYEIVMDLFTSVHVYYENRTDRGLIVSFLTNI